MIAIEVRRPQGGDPDPGGDRRLLRAVVESTLLLKASIQKETPVGVTSAARGSITEEVRTGSVAVGSAIGVGTVIGVVGSPLKHLVVLNDGRRPGQRMPPPEALELWVRRKIQITQPASGRRGESRRKPTVDEARNIAFLIARKIAARGTPPVQMFEKAIAANSARIERIFADAGFAIAITELRKGRP